MNGIMRGGGHGTGYIRYSDIRQRSISTKYNIWSLTASCTRDGAEHCPVSHAVGEEPLVSLPRLMRRS
jgi:hypothetical protein